MRSSTRRGFALAFTGRLSWSPRAQARHREERGHRPHRGAPPGRQTRAPSSIRAWLKSPTRWGRISSSSPSTRRFTLGSKMLSRRCSSLAVTRSTLPSTAVARFPKAMEAMAPAV